MRLKQHEEENFELPLVPIIDMMFVLLIFFMVATTLKATQPVLPIELPVSAASLDQKVEQNIVVIGVDREGHKYLDGNPAAVEDLQKRLHDAAKADANQPVRIDADRDALFDQVVEVLELCQFEGLKNVSFHTRRMAR